MAWTTLMGLQISAVVGHSNSHLVVYLNDHILAHRVDPMMKVGSLKRENASSKVLQSYKLSPLCKMRGQRLFHPTLWIFWLDWRNGELRRWTFSFPTDCSLFYTAEAPTKRLLWPSTVVGHPARSFLVLLLSGAYVHVTVHASKLQSQEWPAGWWYLVSGEDRPHM